MNVRFGTSPASRPSRIKREWEREWELIENLEITPTGSPIASGLHFLEDAPSADRAARPRHVHPLDTTHCGPSGGMIPYSPFKGDFPDDDDDNDNPRPVHPLDMTHTGPSYW